MRNKKTNKKTYKISKQVVFNLDAVMSVTLDDIGLDSELAKNNKYLQRKIAEKLDELLTEFIPELSPVAYKIKIISSTSKSLETSDVSEDRDSD